MTRGDVGPVVVDPTEVVNGLLVVVCTVVLEVSVVVDGDLLVVV